VQGPPSVQQQREPLEVQRGVAGQQVRLRLQGQQEVAGGDHGGPAVPPRGWCLRALGREHRPGCQAPRVLVYPGAHQGLVRPGAHQGLVHLGLALVLGVVEGSAQGLPWPALGPPIGPPL